VELETYQTSPPLQDPANYNLSQVYDEIKKAREIGHTSD
jgi:hypothetical protein